MLFDEPLSNLDAALRIKIREEIKEIVKQAEATTIFVTHDKEEAMFLGDRIAIMNNGKIEQIDTPEYIYNQPLTKFVAEFMDPASFIDVNITDPHTLSSEIGEIKTKEALVTDKQNLQILIRGNNVELSHVKGSCLVESIEFKGSHYSYTIKLPSGKIIEYISQDNNLKVSDNVTLSIKKEITIHIYQDEKYMMSTKVKPE